MKRPDEDWLLWQLADSAFPTGGFAHSGGLEAAWQHGELRNTAELTSFLQASLRQWACAALPFVTAAHASPHEASEHDRLCDAFLTNHVANRASRIQGQSLALAAEKAFGLARRPLPCGHFAPVFGGVTRRLGLSQTRAANLFFFQSLRGLAAAAIRLGIIGPMEGQAVQHHLAASAEETVANGLTLPLNAICQTSPLLDLWQGAQDRLYSRLFQS